MGWVSGRSCIWTGPAQGTEGDIVITASIAIRRGVDDVAPCFASKRADVSLTRLAVRGLGMHGLTVLDFDCGMVDTEMLSNVDKELIEFGASERPGREGIHRRDRQGAGGDDADITGTTNFLASADSDDMTGQFAMKDGGKALV